MRKEAVLIGEALTKNFILSLASTADVFERGETYYKAGRVVSISFENNNSLAAVTVEGNYKNYDIILRFSHLGEFKEYNCTCESGRIWKGACKHAVAALLAVSELKSELLTQPSMDMVTRKLSDNLEKQIYKEIDESIAIDTASAGDGQKLRLEPKLLLGGGKPCLNFYIGNSRVYIIKSVNEFAGNMKRQAVASYGSNLRFKHSLSVFDSDSQGLLNFILNENEIYNEVSKSIMENYNYMYMAKENGRNLPLTERNSDSFFELLINKTLDTDNGKMALLDEPPPISFEVWASPEEISLKGGRMDFSRISGGKYDYIICGNTIYRTDKNRGMIISAVAESLEMSKAPCISFKGNERVRFISVILPYLNRGRLISAITGELDSAVTAPMLPKLYFSAEGAEVRCRLEFCYGDAAINPLKQQDMVIARDLPSEYRITRHLCMYGFEPDEGGAVYKLMDEDAIYRLLHDGLEDLKNKAEIYATNELIRQKPKTSKSKVNISVSGGLISLLLEDSELSFPDLIDALGSLRQKKKYHRLKDGRFIDLEDNYVQSAARLIGSLDLTLKDVGDFSAELPKYRSYYIDQLTEGNKAVKRGAEFQELAMDFRRMKDSAMTQPESLNGALREYQKTGFSWLCSLSRFGFGGVLADDMGLGKTVQVIAFLLSAHEPGKQSLIVSPTSLVYNWEAEINRFAPSLAVQVIAGAQEKRGELLEIPADVYITTYDSLKRDKEFYADRTFETLIADEAQYIKNPETQNAKSIKSIKSKNRFALTGTPIENSLTELWSIFDFIMPGYLFSFQKFNKLYETPIVKLSNKDRAEALKRQISPFLLRRMKSEVLTELPEKTETNLYAELLPAQRDIYMAQLLKAREILRLGGSLNRVRIFAELTRLRQICCHPALCIEGYESGSGKLALALETVQMALESGRRPLLFSQFTSMLSILTEELRRMGFSFFYLDGSTPAADRVDLVNRFNQGERELFLISLKAGGTGLNLTGADVVIHYDPWWNPSVMDQATDRAHRIGQKRAVQVFNLLTRGTIEQKIIDIHDMKKNLIDSVLSDGDEILNRMTDEEVRELFNV